MGEAEINRLRVRLSATVGAIGLHRVSLFNSLFNAGRGTRRGHGSEYATECGTRTSRS
jgi:hypothetical protein